MFRIRTYFIAALLTACLSGTAQVKKIMIDPAAATGGVVSKYFEDVTYVPLETTKESLFGKIDKMEVTDQFYIILDQATDAILFFKKDGRFDHKITNFHFDRMYKIIQQPNHPMGVVKTFSADPVNHLLYIESIFESESLYIFTENGEKVGKINMPSHTFDYFILRNGGHYYRQGRPRVYEKPATFQPYDISYKKDSIHPLRYLLPVAIDKEQARTDIGFHMKYFFGATGDSTCMYTPDMDYNLYELDSTGIKNQYQLLFPQQYALPVNFARDSSNEAKKEYLKTHNVINNIWSAWKTGDYLLLSFVVPQTASLQGGSYHLLYSLRSSRLITLDRISPDNKSYQLPVSIGMRSDILACENNNVYFSFPSVTMFNMLEKFEGKRPEFDKELTHYFKTQDRKSNPVLLRLKLKSNL